MGAGVGAGVGLGVGLEVDTDMGEGVELDIGLGVGTNASASIVAASMRMASEASPLNAWRELNPICNAVAKSCERTKRSISPSRVLLSVRTVTRAEI